MKQLAKRYMTNPAPEHAITAKITDRWLAGSKVMKLRYRRQHGGMACRLLTHADTKRTGDPETQSVWRLPEEMGHKQHGPTTMCKDKMECICTSHTSAMHNLNKAHRIDTRVNHLLEMHNKCIMVMQEQVV